MVMDDEKTIYLKCLFMPKKVSSEKKEKRGSNADIQEQTSRFTWLEGKSTETYFVVIKDNVESLDHQIKDTGDKQLTRADISQ